MSSPWCTALLRSAVFALGLLLIGACQVQDDPGASLYAVDQAWLETALAEEPANPPDLGAWRCTNGGWIDEQILRCRHPQAGMFVLEADYEDPAGWGSWPAGVQPLLVAPSVEERLAVWRYSGEGRLPVGKYEGEGKVSFAGLVQARGGYELYRADFYAESAEQLRAQLRGALYLTDPLLTREHERMDYMEEASPRNAELHFLAPVLRALDETCHGLGLDPVRVEAVTTQPWVGALEKYSDFRTWSEDEARAFPGAWDFLKAGGESPQVLRREGADLPWMAISKLHERREQMDFVVYLIFGTGAKLERVVRHHARIGDLMFIFDLEFDDGESLPLPASKDSR